MLKHSHNKVKNDVLGILFTQGQLVTCLDVTKYTRRSNLRAGKFILATVPGDTAHPKEEGPGQFRGDTGVPDN